MGRRARPRSEPGLFDQLPRLPDEAGERAEPSPPEPESGGAEGELPLFPPPPPAPSTAESAAEMPAETLARAASAPASLVRERLQAGLLDLAVLLAIALAALLGLALLDVEMGVSGWPALALFLLAFSFLYITMPLAFWGRTLGMARAGLRAGNADGLPLAFGQTVRRWLGAVLTLAGLGLPFLVALGGDSLADRLSRSRTLRG